MKQRFFSAILFLLLCSLGILNAQQYVIKFATLAPKGSTWMNVMEEFDKAVRTETGGKVGFKIYAGGVQGDEKGVLRKIRAGQLHSAGFTGVGMGEIAPMVRILDSPFLFNSYPEVDKVYETYDAGFRKAFEDAGYVLLGWAEVGFVYVYTNTPVRKPADLNGIKLWTWEGDPIAESAFKTLGVSPIPLSITDVMTSLQTGLIDAVYSPPMVVVALQWFTRVKYMIDVPLANSAGAILVSKKMFDQIPPDLQQILLKNGKKYMDKLTNLSRQENKTSIAEIQKRGIVILKADPKDIQTYVEVGRKSRRSLIGKMYTEQFLNSVEKTVDDVREKNSK